MNVTQNTLKQDSAFRHKRNGRYWHSNSVRPFVGPWHSGIVSKRLKGIEIRRNYFTSG